MKKAEDYTPQDVISNPDEIVLLVARLRSGEYLAQPLAMKHLEDRTVAAVGAVLPLPDIEHLGFFFGKVLASVSTNNITLIRINDDDEFVTIIMNHDAGRSVMMTRCSAEKTREFFEGIFNENPEPHNIFADSFGLHHETWSDDPERYPMMSFDEDVMMSYSEEHYIVDGTIKEVFETVRLNNLADETVN